MERPDPEESATPALDLPPDFTESRLRVGSLEVRILDSRPDEDPGARAFVLAHGLGVSSLYYRELADDLLPHGRVVALDLPGFGRTDKPDKALRIGHYAGVVTSAVRHLGLGDVVLIGHSMGCQVVTETLVLNPGIATSAALIGPVVNSTERRLGILTRRFFQSVLKETPSSVLPSLLAWARCGPRMLINTIPPMLGYRLEERITHVDIPLLLIAGAMDRLAPQEWLTELQRRSRGSAQVEIVPGASHQVMVTHPARVTAAILALDRRDGG